MKLTDQLSVSSFSHNGLKSEKMTIFYESRCAMLASNIFKIIVMAFFSILEH